jgi:hypothetical protein
VFKVSMAWVVAWTAAPLVWAEPVHVFDAQGFESYQLGPISGQNNWWGGGLNFNPKGLPGAEPVIAALPDGSRALRLEVPDSNGAYSGVAAHWAATPIPAANNPVTVEYDILRVRDAWASNLWWNWQMYAGDQPGGLQWDSSSGTSVTLPFGFGGPSRPTAMGHWAHLKTTYHFVQQWATAEYDGTALGPVSFGPTQMPVGYEIDLLHDEASGSGPETVWIDNFVVTATPEPGSAALLLLVLAGARGFRGAGRSGR